MFYNTYIKAWELLTDCKTKSKRRNKSGLCGGKDRCGTQLDRSHHDSFPWMNLKVGGEMRRQAQSIFPALASYCNVGEKSNCGGHHVASSPFLASLLALSLVISSQSTALCL